MRDSRISLDDLLMGGRFICRLPFFLRHRIDLALCRLDLHQRLETRDADFLALVKRGIYAFPDGFYCRFLRTVGCECGDLEKLVRQEGLEGALHVLFRKGVYLTANEFRGRTKVERGSTVMEVTPPQLRNPLVTPQVAAVSGGSRSQGVPMARNFAYMRMSAADKGLVMAARDGLGWTHGYWGVSGSAAVSEMVEYSLFGAPIER